jgi:signal transduction histidine kinase
MSPSVQKRIFDSGFTTKTRGWGLGLPLARRIVNQYHRGRLYLKYSVSGQGSCFRIELRKKS